MSRENEMSEWHAIQRKPKSRLRQALLELEDKANPRLHKMLHKRVTTETRSNSETKIWH